MQPEIDAQLSNFFEDAPARDFAKVMRGYDPHQVDEYLKQSELEMRQHREQAQALQQELTEAHRQLREQERPTYAGLGSRIEQLLRLAEEQATEIVGEARSAATNCRPPPRWTLPSCGPAPRTRRPSCGPAPSARPTTCAAPPSGKPTPSAPGHAVRP